MSIKQEKRYRRHKRVRAKIKGTSKIPRLCVFRSNKHIYTQLIDDEKGKILIAASDLEIKLKVKSPAFAKASAGKQKSKVKEDKKEQVIKTRKATIAYAVGQLVAKRAIEKKIEKVVFDRGGYKYHGRIKALADGAKEKGLKF